jgi:hypothetical protein
MSPLPSALDRVTPERNDISLLLSTIASLLRKANLIADDSDALCADDDVYELERLVAMATTLAEHADELCGRDREFDGSRTTLRRLRALAGSLLSRVESARPSKPDGQLEQIAAGLLERVMPTAVSRPA